MFLADLVKKNGDKIVHYTKGQVGKKYMSIFDYSEMYGGTFDSFKYYNDYYIELGDDNMEQQIALMSGILKLNETYRELKRLNFSNCVLNEIEVIVDDLMGLIENKEIEDYLLSIEVDYNKDKETYSIKILGDK